MSWIKKKIDYCIEFLSNHRRIPTFLSHGGIHLILLACLLCLVVILYKATEKHEEMNYSHITVHAEQFVHPSTDKGKRGPNYTKSHANFQCDFFSGSFNINNGSVNCCLDYIIDGKVKNYLWGDSSSYLRFQITTDTEGTELFADINELSDRIYLLDDTWDYETKGLIDSINYKDTLRYIRYYPYKLDSIMLTVNKHNRCELIYDQTIQKYASYSEDSFKETLSFPIRFTIKENNKKDKYTSFDYYIELPDFKLDSLSHWKDASHYPPKEYSFVISYGDTNKPFDLRYVFPQPDVISPNHICFNSKESIARIFQNGGVRFIIEDITARNKGNRRAFLFTVLIGAVITFMFDILVGLIRKWRNLKQKSNRQSQNKSSKSKRKKRRKP